VMINSSDADVD